MEVFLMVEKVPLGVCNGCYTSVNMRTTAGVVCMYSN